MIIVDIIIWGGGGEGGRNGESKTLFSVGTLKVLMDVGM